MARARTPRSAWIREGFRALAAGGPEAVRVEPLAKALGVTKGGFYGYFASRRALLDEMLDAWERAMVDEVIEEVEAAGGDERERLRRLFRRGSDPRVNEMLEVELAIRDWARRERGVAERLRRVDNRRMDYMRRLFGPLAASPEEVEVRCLLAFSLFIGNFFIAADHGARSRAAVVRDALRHLEGAGAV